MKIEKLIKDAHDPALVDDPMVYELWQDGEITLTKGGSLFRQRSLHMIYPPVLDSDCLKYAFKGANVTGQNMSIFTTRDKALAIRDLMGQLW